MAILKPKEMAERLILFIRFEVIIAFCNNCSAKLRKFIYCRGMTPE